jgi:hypothetical protein
VYLLAAALSLCASNAVLVQPAKAASPYVVDGVALGESFHGTRHYHCSPSEQFADYAWCRRSHHGRTRRGTFVSITSILHGHGSVAYVDREVRPAFFARNDIPGEIERLSAKFGPPAQEMRLPVRENVSQAVIVVWGRLRLELLDGNDIPAIQSGTVSPQSMLVDHLGNVRESLRLGLPVYRLKGGPGYLWSADLDQGGRGHLRFLAMDGPALAGIKNDAPSKPIKEAAVAKPGKAAAALTGGESTGFAAANDLRIFFTPQPASIMSTEAARPVVSHDKNKTQQSIVQKTRIDAERARLADAERLAADEREKARLAWARYETETAAFEARARVKWIVVASLFILMAVLALLRIMTREPPPATEGTARSTVRAKAEALLRSWMHFVRDLRKTAWSPAAISSAGRN